MPLSGRKLDALLIKTSATAIANQAILKCMFSGIVPTVDNAIRFIGDFFDPTDQDFAEIIPEIEHALEFVLQNSTTDHQ